MAIVDSKNGLEFVYSIPEKIASLFSESFRNEFRSDAIESFGDDPEEWIFFCGTVGWDNCFKRAAVKCGIKQVYDYYWTLEWYDRDLFDEQLLELMM